MSGGAPSPPAISRGGAPNRSVLLLAVTDPKPTPCSDSLEVCCK